MIEHPETTPAEAMEDHDITLALTPGQLLMIVIGLFVLARLIGRLKG